MSVLPLLFCAALLVRVSARLHAFPRLGQEDEAVASSAAPAEAATNATRHPWPGTKDALRVGEADMPKRLCAHGWEQWVFCADEHMQCQCPGMIRWGTHGHWNVMQPVVGAPTVCSVEAHGDPNPSLPMGKRCECAMKRGSETWFRLSPAVVPEGDGSEPVVSCSHIEAGAKHHRWGAELWKASQGLCGRAGHKDKLPEAGPLALEEDVVEDLMKAWVDHRFRENYERIYDKDGWVERAYVNYVGNCAEDGTYDRMMEQLIRSVHLFSKEPIIVVHFGMMPPRDWDPHKFPRLVLLHAKPLPQEERWRSFNYNKYRAMLLSRARVGIELDSDQFVAPGADALFRRTAEEITQDYPMPILPVHFLANKGPAGGGVWWPRFCHEDRECPLQTMRWAHAHPTWTYFALPWLGKWLRRNLRDEVLPPRAGFKHSGLRVLDVPEDEDLLNVGLWEDNATKQWCKFETPDPSEFHFLFDRRTDGLGDIKSDGRFYPDGAPLVFYTAHHAVDPDASKKLIAELRFRQEAGDLPPPISFKGHYYRNSEDLRRGVGSVPCII